MSNMTVLLNFTGPISASVRRRAEQLSRQQATPEKGEQVRLNNLAVSFVNSYLQCMGFETDLEASDSWNPVQQMLMDAADLSLKNLGFLECRPVWENTQLAYVPPEVKSNRIGYAIVQISKTCREATLLGFVKQVSTNSIPISELQPLENLLEYLEELSQVNLAESASPSIAPSQTLINLKQWFENIFEAGWQEISALLDAEPANLDWSFRSACDVVQGKLIDLGRQLPGQAVVLVVALALKHLQEMDITVEVHPSSGQDYLPPNLQLQVLDEDRAAVMEAQARSENKNIQFNFSGEPGERFSVKVALGNVSVIEDFVI